MTPSGLALVVCVAISAPTEGVPSRREGPAAPSDGGSEDTGETGGRAQVGTRTGSSVELEFLDESGGLVRGLRPSPDGGYDYSDPGKRFDAHVQPDGAVSFVIALPLAAGFCMVGVCPSARAVKREGGTRGVERGLDTILGIDLAPAPVGFMVAFDLMPAPHEGMRKFLARTFEMRVAMAIAWNQEQIDRQLRGLDGELLALWQDESLPLAQRQAIVFQRWEECGSGLPGTTTGAATAAARATTAATAGVGAPRGAKIDDEPALRAAVEGEIDRARRVAGEHARRTIEAFVRRHAPRGSANAFSRADLRRLNGARVDRFDPYRGVDRRGGEGPPPPNASPATPSPPP